MKEQLEGQGIPVVHDKTNMGNLLASKMEMAAII